MAIPAPVRRGKTPLPPAFAVPSKVFHRRDRVRRAVKGKLGTLTVAEAAQRHPVLALRRTRSGGFVDIAAARSDYQDRGDGDFSHHIPKRL